jgi:uncharacterized protein (TIGR02246 family)
MSKLKLNLESKMSTKFLSATLALLLAYSGFLSSFSQDVDNRPAGEAVSSDEDRLESEMEAIRSASAGYVVAFNDRDAEKLAQFWSENGVYEVPDSKEQLKGRRAIQEMFKVLFAKYEDVKMTVTIDSIRLITSNVASEMGHAFVSSQGSTSVSRYSAIYVKEGGLWLLDSIHETDVELTDSKQSPLAQLEWMVGEWVDQGDDSAVETDVHWTANGKFLTRNFRVLVPGNEMFSGTQVIGWDPIHQQVRSWVFDSAGGFSNGSWKRKGENWVVESTGYLADGRTASSIQVFAQVDDNSFTWQSFGREVDGVRLPDIETVRVVRKEASKQLGNN